MQYPSKWIEEAVNQIAHLPGIGKKTALRLVLHLLKKDKVFTEALVNSLTNLKEKTQYCEECGNISDANRCAVCISHRRDHSVICVVEDTRDVLAIENTGQYNGVYHVIGGVISPMNGIGPEDLSIDKLLNRVKTHDEVKEIILALSPTMEGDTTAFYISRKLDSNLKISTIARGIPVGGELEYADEITLGRSILSRTSYTSE